jgi:hypothetical protein
MSDNDILMLCQECKRLGYRHDRVENRISIPERENLFSSPRLSDPLMGQPSLYPVSTQGTFPSGVSRKGRNAVTYLRICVKVTTPT